MPVHISATEGNSCCCFFRFPAFSQHFCATAVQHEFRKFQRIHSLSNCPLRRQVSGSIPLNSRIMSANDDSGPASQKGHAIILFYRNK